MTFKGLFFFGGCREPAFGPCPRWREAPWPFAAAQSPSYNQFWKQKHICRQTEGREGRDSYFAFPPFANINVPGFVLIKPGLIGFNLFVLSLKPFKSSLGTSSENGAGRLQSSV